MAFDLHIVKTSDFVRLDPRGKFDVAASRRMLESVAQACVSRGVTCALLDIRDARSNLELADFYHLISAFREMGFRKEHRLAVLHRYSGQEKADFFAMCAASRGWNVRSLDSFEDAFAWFATELPAESSSPQASDRAL